MVAGKRVDAIEDDAGGDPVVPVPSVEVAVRAIRVLRDDQVWLPPADLAGHVQPALARVIHLAVLVAEELDMPDAQRSGGIPLLGFADQRQALRRNGAIG